VRDSDSRTIAIVSQAGIYPPGVDADGLWRMVLESGWAGGPPPAGRWTADPAALVDPNGTGHDRAASDQACLLAALPALSPDLLARAGLPNHPDPACALALLAGLKAFYDCRHQMVDTDRLAVILGHIALPTPASARRARDPHRADLARLGVPAHALQGPDDSAVNPAWAPAHALARALGAGGTVLTLDAACASTYYAIALACEELLAQRADCVLAGGVSSPDPVYTQVGFTQLRALSAKGRALPFDRSADGLVVGEGAGVFALKRLSDALAQGDTILGLVRAVGLSNDDSGPLLVPKSQGQLAALRQAYRDAGWSPGMVDWIECHATGTPVGDAAELESLHELWRGEEGSAGRCALGSVKGVVGHMLTAAGAPGLSKALSALAHGVIPPCSGVDDPLPELDAASPFRLPAQPTPWHRRSPDVPRRVALSGFGFGGINAHLLLEEFLPGAPAKPAVVVSPKRSLGIACVSAVTWDASDHSTVSVRGGRVPLPPREAGGMLPQQVVTRELARHALEPLLAGQGEENSLSRLGQMGIFVGSGLDSRTTGFHLRWLLAGRCDWITESQLGAVHPALDAEHTLGNLVSLAASRVAREFQATGPSFVLCADEVSGLAALECARRALQNRVIDVALVAGVDLDPEFRGHDPVARPGAALLVLQRLEDAVGRKHPILGVLRGVGISHHGAPTGEASSGHEAAGCRALEQAFAESEIHPERLGQMVVDGEPARLVLSEILGPRGAEGQCVASPPAPRHQYTGHAAGLLGLADLLHRLHDRVLAPTPGLAVDRADGCVVSLANPAAWLAPSSRDRRLGGVLHLGGGQAACVLVEEGPIPREPDVHLDDVGDLKKGLKLAVVEGADASELAAALEALANQPPASGWIQGPVRPEAPYAVALMPASPSGLASLARAVAARLRDRGIQALDALGEIPGPGRALSTSQPLQGDLALVFPGSGMFFPGMGRELAAWVGTLASEDLTADIWRPDRTWWQGAASREENTPGSGGHVRRMLAQVALGRLVTQALLALGVPVSHSLGFSLGESAQLLALDIWPDREGMRQDLQLSSLFHNDLVNPWRAPRRALGLPEDESFTWSNLFVELPADQVLGTLDSASPVYLLARVGPEACLVGGEDRSVRAWARRHAPDRFVPLPDATAAHCPAAQPALKAYRELHTRPVQPRPGVTCHFASTTGPVPHEEGALAEAFVRGLLHPLDFPATIRRMHAEGVRHFLEVGPGSSCTRWAGLCLPDLPHHALALQPGPTADLQGIDALVQGLAHVAVHRLGWRMPDSLRARSQSAVEFPAGPVLAEVPLAPHHPVWPAKPAPAPPPPTPPVPSPPPVVREIVVETPPAPVPPPPPPTPAPPRAPQPVVMEPALVYQEDPFWSIWSSARRQTARAHEAYLRHHVTTLGALGRLVSAPVAEIPAAAPVGLVEPPAALPDVHHSMTWQQCLHFARGSVAQAMGARYAPIDHYPSRVRLPDEPLLLVHKVHSIEGEPCSMTTGRVVTDHTIRPDAWYLDQGCIPLAVCVEAGQADMLLAGWLGIDFQTKGLAFYRLLDAEVTYHAPRPGVGKTILYDIHVDGFFRHGETNLFRFHYDATVDGQPLLSMRGGCAGFFSPEELARGKGLLGTSASRPPVGSCGDQFAPPGASALDRAALDRLRHGDLTPLHPSLGTLPLGSAPRLPGGLLTLIHTIPHLDPTGGAHGLGVIHAELEIETDAWYLVCHFVDDQVMPGTLMYEGCAQALRVLLWRMGFVAPEGSWRADPVPGVTSKLKCRGQVIPGSRVLRYEVTVRELTLSPEPRAIADAILIADGKPIVEIRDMSLGFTGVSVRLDCDYFQNLWSRQLNAAPKKILYGPEQIMAYAVGNPSEGFGDRYTIFDQGRILARLPGPPYLFVDRVTGLDATPWQLREGAMAEAEYDIPPDAWYFTEGAQPDMPFAVLLEVALQVCGWLAAHGGAALTSPIDLSFRNLGGKARQLVPVLPRDGTLVTQVRQIKVSASGGMILLEYTLDTRCKGVPVYQGWTSFGFFSKEALSKQVGLIDDRAKFWQPDTPPNFLPYPEGPCEPNRRWRMIDRVAFLAGAGEAKLGWLEGRKDVSPDEWFFHAHFYQDPVWPGSLGLEGFLQLVSHAARVWWGPGHCSLEPGTEHEWIYRGQVTPGIPEVRIIAEITGRDDSHKRVRARGWLLVGDKVLYAMNRFQLSFHERGREVR